MFWQQRLPDCVVAYPFFFLRRKKNEGKKELQGGCPLDPRCGERHHHRMGYQRDGSVQAAQRGQIKARTVKRSAANILLGFPLRGSQSKGRAARLANKHFFARTRKLFPLCTTSLLFVSPGLPVPWGVSGGGAALSSLCRRFPGGDIMNLISRRSPLSGLSFSLFFFLRRKKKRYWRRRSREISVGEAKCYICRHKRAAALHLIRRLSPTPVSLRLVSVAVPQAELRVLVPTGNQFNTAPLLRSPQGEGKVGSCRAARRTNTSCPEHRNFLRCAQHLCCLSHPACPFSGGSRGAEPH